MNPSSFSDSFFFFLFNWVNISFTVSLERPRNFSFFKLLILSLKNSVSNVNLPFVSFWIVILAKLLFLFLDKYPVTKSDRSLFVMIFDKLSLSKLIFDKNQQFKISLLFLFKKFSNGFFC